ncbi:hypothetical protein B6U98_02055 [Thermoplasmatales archaeon ex4572_165]|nr:MAG: hypothetical protein B6U98_02055 [Thermoplasmatales archaeon ex4572_165]RLF59594.1 MAG: hypothetical protein DRN27_02075 [Thermoplasmata archaeon]
MVLRKIQQGEKSSPLLSKIDDHFFEDASSYCSLLRKRLNTEKKPSRNLILSEQTQNVEKIIRNIYELREKKIMLAAMSKARGGSPPEKQFLPGEKQLFNSIYSLLIDTRNTLFDYNETKNPTSEKVPLKNQNNSEITNKVEPQINKDNHTVIRILENIPTFIGTDTKQYDLKKNDIVSIPDTLASMLIKKHVAEIVSMNP